MAPELEEYIVQLVLATRDPGRWDAELVRLVSYGASPRATIALDRCARARAWLDGRDYVSPDDIQAVVHDVMRHRVLLVLRSRGRWRDRGRTGRPLAGPGSGALSCPV